MAICFQTEYSYRVTRSLLSLVLGLTGLLAPLQAQSTAPPPVVTAYFTERPPFAVVEGQTGILVNLTKTILAEAGVRARFIELPESRVLELFRLGQTDALYVGWYRSPRSGTARQSLPIYQEQPVVALMNARMVTTIGLAPRLDGLLSSSFTLGLKSGRSLGPAVDQKVRSAVQVPIETMVTMGGLLRLVHGGRMDYTLMSEEEAQYLLKQDPKLLPGLSLARLLDAPPGSLRCFLFPEGFDPLLADRIDVAIERLRNSARSPAAARPLLEIDPPMPLDLPTR